MSFKFCNHFDWEKGASCFTLIVFQMSWKCWRSVALDLPPGTIGCMRCVIVVFPDHTYLIFLQSLLLYSFCIN